MQRFVWGNIVLCNFACYNMSRSTNMDSNIYLAGSSTYISIYEGTVIYEKLVYPVCPDREAESVVRPS